MFNPINTKPQLKDNYEHMMSPVAKRLSERHWESARATSIGGAGLSTAIVFLLTQVSLDSFTLNISFFCAALAIPVWLALWQVGEAYLFYGNVSHDHFKKSQGSGLGVSLFIFGGILLLISFTALIWHFNILVGITFLIASLAMFVLVYKHNTSVRIWVEQNTSLE